MSLRIRPFRKSDAETIINWCKDEESFYKWNAGILGQYPITFERMVAAMSKRDDSIHFFPFTAFDDHGVVGFFTLRHPTEVLEELRFGFVIVDPEKRGKGYGKQMLSLGIKYAFEVYGADTLSLGVFIDNESAYKCYKSVGFEPNGITETYEIYGRTWICMDMKLEKQHEDGLFKKEELIKKMIRTSLEMRKQSYSPYSQYAVGAAVLTENGNIYSGCNIENAAYTPTICAERTAIFKAVSEGNRDIIAIAVSAGKAGKEIEKGGAPCGVCRQVMMEFAKNPKTFEIYVVTNEEKYEVFTLDELLPRGFGAADLG